MIRLNQSELQSIHCNCTLIHFFTIIHIFTTQLTAKLHTKATNHSPNLLLEPFIEPRLGFLRPLGYNVKVSHPLSPTHKCLCHSIHYLIPSTVQWKLTTLLQKKPIHFPLSIRSRVPPNLSLQKEAQLATFYNPVQ